MVGPKDSAFLSKIITMRQGTRVVDLVERSKNQGRKERRNFHRVVKQDAGKATGPPTNVTGTFPDMSALEKVDMLQLTPE